MISPVQIAVDPLATRSGYAGRTARSTIEVPLYGVREGRSIVPQQAPTDAHARRNEVPQIPLAYYIMA